MIAEAAIRLPVVTSSVLAAESITSGIDRAVASRLWVAVTFAPLPRAAIDLRHDLRHEELGRQAALQVDQAVALGNRCVDLAGRHEVGILGEHVKEVGLVRPCGAVADGVGDDERDEPARHRIDAGRPHAARGRTAGEEHGIHPLRRQLRGGRGAE
jgi:hypothetical protein